MVANDAYMVVNLTANLVTKNDANLALPPRFRQVLIESPLQRKRPSGIWWPAEQKICSQTKIPSKEHLGWGIASGFVNGTHVGKQEKGQFLVPVPLITGYQEREAVLDGPIEPLYHAVRLRMQSCCPGFVDGEYFPQCPANWRIEVSPLFIVQL
ncbi:hypothetical protein TNCV_1559751 [Trichonephila clavipes]|nr:hypothetical protein TNCV_1559751 [Trichonephila clavipes]